MKMKYDWEEDVLLIEVMPEGRIDHAEQSDSLIAHLTADGRIVLLEILDASHFLTAAFQHMIRRGAEVPA
ncbi:MAG: DUF2283 domain-containing protein [Anaerolineae bacterium]|nr:DUF2283 domain-containing protein [Anaerolineae bacterium]MDW8068976.1 DUF2283 domain-containing protein [Anaerolineae bacterium]